MAQKIRVLERLEEMPLWTAAEAHPVREAERLTVRQPLVAEARRIGLFVDAQNVRLECLGGTIEGLMKVGDLRVRRAFGHWPGVLAGPSAVVQMKYAIELRQCPVLTNFGKNAADIAMVVDVMDVLGRDEIDVFALVSSDSDFTPLVHHLARSGKEVWGYGLASAPDSLRMACARFDEIAIGVEAEEGGGEETSVGKDVKPPKMAAKKAAAVAPKSALKRAVREAVERHAGGWKLLSEIGGLLGQAGVTAKSLGASTLSEVFRGRAGYEMKEFGGAGNRCVREVMAGQPAAAGGFTPDESVILKEVLARLGAGRKWVNLSVLREELRADGRLDVQRHQGKLGKRVRKLDGIEPHATDPQLVRLVASVMPQPYHP